MSKSFEFNQKLISVIEKTYPKKNDQLTQLMDLIFLGKEAAYRRLRGDVPFSFSEACTIAQHLGISLDEIVYEQEPNKSRFELRIPPEDIIEYHEQVLDVHVELFDELLGDPTIRIHSAYNVIPHALFLLYENLSKSRTLKWKYQMENNITPIKFSDIVIPEKILVAQKTLAKKIEQIPENTLVFDRYIFSSFVKEMRYFHYLGLITDEEIRSLRDELYDLIDSLELASIKGENCSGKKIWLFLSNIEFDSEYIVVESDTFNMAYIDVYLMNSLMTADPRICKMQKRWIDSLRKYSTLISGSGELERKEFFRKQREIISAMI